MDTILHTIAAALPAHESNPWWIAAVSVLYMLTGSVVFSLALRAMAWAALAILRPFVKRSKPEAPRQVPPIQVTSYGGSAPTRSFSQPAKKGFTRRNDDARPMLRLIVSASTRQEMR